MKKAQHLKLKFIEELEQSKSVRQKTFRELLKHVKGGYSLDCFPSVSQKTIENLLLQYPEEWVEDELVEAMREGKRGWEAIGRRQAEGTCLGNSRAWFYNMAHRYNWSEKQQIDVKTEGTLAVNIVSYADSIERPVST
jgi:hypothetical protein